MGSGSTIAAAKVVGYSSTGLEVDPEYFRLAEKAIPRLAALYPQFKGQEIEVELNGNVEREAEFRARATTLELSAFSATDPRTLLAVALKGLGENASEIGTLTITTEMLASILNGRTGDGPQS